MKVLTVNTFDFRRLWVFRNLEGPVEAKWLANFRVRKLNGRSTLRLLLQSRGPLLGLSGQSPPQPKTSDLGWLLPFVSGLADSRNRTIAAGRVSRKLPVARAYLSLSTTKQPFVVALSVFYSTDD